MSNQPFFRFFLLLTCAAAVSGQDAAELSGTVVNPERAGVAGAEVTLHGLRNSSVRSTVTDNAGLYFFDSLAPGDYGLEVTKEGFHKLKVQRVRLRVRDRRSLVLPLQVNPVDPSLIPLTAAASGITTEGGVSVVLDHADTEVAPLRRQSVYSMILMSPGLVGLPTGPGGDGAVSANGLRPDMNYWTVDGAGVDTATALPIESIAGIRVQSSSFAPEFGRSPGAQISITTRGGTDRVHGSVFGYTGNDKFSANDWCANRAGLARGALHDNHFGGALSGPAAGQTYFSISYEGSRLRQPETAVSTVPSLEVRQSTAQLLVPFLNAFPVPNGPDLGAGASQYTAVLSNSLTSDLGSARVDHAFSERFRLMMRYGYARTKSQFRGDGFVSPNVLTDRALRTQNAAAALSWTPTPHTTNDLRVSVAGSSFTSSSSMDGFGGAIPLTDSQVFPAGIDGSTGELRLSIAGVGGYSHRAASRENRHQVNIVNHLTSLQENHTLKFGTDFRRLAPTVFQKPYTADFTFSGLRIGSTAPGALLSGTATTTVVSSNTEAVYPSLVNVSLYLQDTWKTTERTTLTYGIRWDINPAPAPRSGPPLLAFTGSGVSRFDPLYSTKWKNIAPRLGLAYQLDTKPGREMVFRTGIGVFFDIWYGAAIDAFAAAPYSSRRILKDPQFPLTSADLEPPSLPSSRPYGQVNVAGSGLSSPFVYQWNTVLERNFGFTQSASLGFIRTAGRKLLRMESRASYAEDYDLLRIGYNDTSSDYQGVQAQFTKRLATNLQTRISYTLAHSIDNAPAESGRPGFVTLFGNERADSDFDVRHTLSVSGSYRPLVSRPGRIRKLFEDWWVDWILSARSSMPFDVEGITAVSSETSDSAENDEYGLYAQVRADYNGEPAWITDALAPGGRRLNSDAFTLPEEYEQGTLGRNSLRGFGAAQLDLSLRRQISVIDRWRIHIAAQAFNVFNRANFANFSFNESAYLSSPDFGTARRMLNQLSAGGVLSAGLMGGPRSMRLSLRFEF